MIEIFGNFSDWMRKGVVKSVEIMDDISPSCTFWLLYYLFILLVNNQLKIEILEKSHKKLEQKLNISSVVVTTVIT